MPGFIENIARRFGYVKGGNLEARGYSLTDYRAFLSTHGLDIPDVMIDEQTALGMSALYRCVWLISSMLATAPLKVFREVEGQGANVDKRHPNYILLALRPNEMTSSFVMRQSLWAQVLLKGNAVVVPEWDRYGRAKALKLMDCKHVVWVETADEKLLVMNGKTRAVYMPEDYLHFKDLSLDGEIGKSRMGLMRDTLQTQLRAEQFVDKYYAKGTFLNGYLKTERALSDTDAKSIGKNWDDTYGGVANSFQTPVLPLGTDYKQVTKTNTESQLVEFLQYAPMKIYQMFGVPPMLASDTEKSTSFGKGIEDMFIQFRQTTVLPLAVMAEQEINYKLFRSGEIGEYFVKHNLDVIERANYQNRMEGLSKGIQNGIYNPNDARKLEDLNPYGAGDTYMVNGNMQRVQDVKDGRSFLNTKNGKNQGEPSA